MKEELLYHEELASNWTTALFAGLAILFGALFVWRLDASGLQGFTIAFLVFFVIFLFYTFNYRTLVIRITRQELKLTFGLITWVVPLNNIELCKADELQPLERYGGAGIHFMLVHGRYRVNFNLLEYPRLVIMLKRKAGPVRDVSFSTRQPDDILKKLQNR